MRVACIGGGPAGLYLAISLKIKDPTHEIDIFERNKSDDTFGWGVVLSDETLDNLMANDEKSAIAIREQFAYWDDIAVVRQDARTVSSGHGFCGIGRKTLLLLLKARAEELGVGLHYMSEVSDIDELMRSYDVVVASDGINSATRTKFSDHFRPELDQRKCKFIWLGTHQKFDDAFTFIFEQTPHGWVWAHAYQFDRDTATFIVECAPETWQAIGFDKMDQAQSIAACEAIFKDHLGGHVLMSNANHLRGSAWLNFTRVLCDKWHHKNIVLLGDAAATAHFSIGSGSKLALESAISLADKLCTSPSLEVAFAAYEDERKIEALRLQSAARNSTEWFEHIDRYIELDPVQFNYALLTRSQRISHENLRLRDKGWLESAERWFQISSGAQHHDRAPMFAPYHLRDMKLVNRIALAPMAQYKAVNGTPTDWHLVHYGERAKGGAGLIYTEMTCVSADGRITPACPGLYTQDHVTAWRRITDFIHTETNAKICCQIGHAGRKGSTQLGWEDMDSPLPADNWPLISASAIAWSPNNQVPREMTRADMDDITNDFVAAVIKAEEAGFDMIELHAAHGYLLSSFLSPLSNLRQDGYGGCLANRLRFPLEVFSAMRAHWPDGKPMSVRISATDWVAGGVDSDEAVSIAKAFYDSGVDIVNVSAGQTSLEAEPVYGRMFQTPFSDQIRNLLNRPTMTAGNIYEADHVNSILLAGRADLVCLGRPHLTDPYWTLHRAAEHKDRYTLWPNPYQAGGDQLGRLLDKPEISNEHH